MDKCLRLARSMSGRSQQVSVSRGAERGSMPKNRLEWSQPSSKSHLNHIKLRKAIKRLLEIVEVHIHFLGEIHEIGNRRIVGMRIFNIVEG